jgi:AraC-like DNA-binding protein
LFGCALAVAQNETVKENEKLQELKNYWQWSSNYGQQKQFDSAAKYDGKALRLVSSLKNDELTALTQFNHAKISFWKADIPEAKKYLALILKNNRLSDSIKFRSNMLFSQVYSYEQNYKDALTAAIDAESILLESGLNSKADSLNMMDIYVIKGNVNKTLENYSQAIEMYDKGLVYNADAGYGSYILFYKSGVYEEEERLQDAIEYAQRALTMAKKANAKVYIPTYYLALSEYYLKLKKADSASYYAKAGLVDNVDCHLDGLRANAGKAALLRGNYVEASDFFNHALQVENVEIPQSEIHKNLRDTYIELKLFEKAITHNELYLRLKDSTEALQMKQEVLEITEKYESDKKEIEIEMLSAQNELNDLVIVKQRNQILFTGISLFLALACLGLIGWFFQKQKKQKQLLYNKNVQLAQHLKESNVGSMLELNGSSTTSDALSLDRSKKNEIITEIENLVAKEFYLDSSMSLAKMAKLMDTNTTYLSKVVNVSYEKNFTNFLNDYRISYTLKMLETNPDYKTLTVDHIADKAGFASSSAFYNAFKKFTGLTPSYYIKQKLLQTH